MTFRLAFGLLCGLALWGAGVGPVQAQSECPYLTKPLVETENGVTRINQWAEGTVLCFHSRVLRCEAAAWHDQGECPDSAAWQALDAVPQEQSAHPVGVTTPAPTILPEAPLSAPTQTVTPGMGARTKETDTTLATPEEKVETPAKSQEPAAEGTSPPEPLGTSPPPPEPSSTPAPAPGESATEAPPIDCSDMQRLSFERVFNKSIVESQRCQAACATDECKHECENQHDNVRGPQIMERFHADACSPIWYP